MSDISAVKALVFDVFGTVVDWRTSLIADFTKWADKRGISATDRAGRRLACVCRIDGCSAKAPERGYVILDNSCTGSHWKNWSRSCRFPVWKKLI
jgi:2-haloacid dehalogenase